MKIEFSTEAETEGSAAIVMNLFKGYTFDFHMKNGRVRTGEVMERRFHNNRPAILICGENGWEALLYVDEIVKAVYC